MTGTAGVTPDEPVRGTFTYQEYPSILTLPGLDQVRRFERQELPPGPLHQLTWTWWRSEWGRPHRVRPVPVASGRFRSDPRRHVAVAADMALTTAIHTTLPPRSLSTTSQLSLNVIRSPGPDCAAIPVRARLIEAGRTQGLSEADVEDSSWRLLARVAARSMIIDVSGALPEAPQEPVPRPEYGTPDPYRRPPQGEVLPQATWDAQDRIQLLRRWAAGSLLRPPVACLLGAEAAAVRPGAVRCTVPASPWLCSMSCFLYGGALALLAQLAMTGAVQSLLPPGTAWAVMDLTIRFLHPVAPDGRVVAARAQVVHQGHRIAVATAEITSTDGKLAAHADCSIQLLPQRRWSDVAASTDESHHLGDGPPVPA